MFAVLTQSDGLDFWPVVVNPAWVQSISGISTGTRIVMRDSEVVVVETVEEVAAKLISDELTDNVKVKAMVMARISDMDLRAEARRRKIRREMVEETNRKLEARSEAAREAAATRSAKRGVRT